MTDKDVSDLKVLADSKQKNWTFVNTDECSIWIQNNHGGDDNGAFDLAKIPLEKLDISKMQVGFADENSHALVTLIMQDNERAIKSVTVSKPDGSYMGASNEPRTFFYLSSPRKAQQSVDDLSAASRDCRSIKTDK